MNDMMSDARYESYDTNLVIMIMSNSSVVGLTSFWQDVTSNCEQGWAGHTVLQQQWNLGEQ